MLGIFNFNWETLFKYLSAITEGLEAIGAIRYLFRNNFIVEYLMSKMPVNPFKMRHLEAFHFFV